MSRFTPQEIWDLYRATPVQDMYDYSPFLREIAQGNVLEIGVRGGVSTAAFLLGLDDKASGHLWSIDIDHRCANIYSHPRWTFLYGYSGAVEIPAVQLDVLMVDGDHHYDFALGDLKRFEPFVRHGGLIMMHDVEPSPQWLPRIKKEAWYPVEECRRAWVDFSALHPTWKMEIKPGMTGLGVIVKGKS